jgi:hypothetical protein
VFPAGGKGFHLPVLPGCINDHDSSRSPGTDTVTLLILILLIAFICHGYVYLNGCSCVSRTLGLGGRVWIYSRTFTPPCPAWGNRPVVVTPPGLVSLTLFVLWFVLLVALSLKVFGTDRAGPFFSAGGWFLHWDVRRLWEVSIGVGQFCRTVGYSVVCFCLLDCLCLLVLWGGRGIRGLLAHLARAFPGCIATMVVVAVQGLLYRYSRLSLRYCRLQSLA